MQQIENIVYVMFENRSFDSVLGWLYSWKQRPEHVIPAESGTLYNGLKTNAYYNLDGDKTRHYAEPVAEDSMQIPVQDPHEKYEHVNYQIFQQYRTPVKGKVQSELMGGFYKDYASIESSNKTRQIMSSFTPKQLPILNGLAKNFAVSDQYYSSVPTQTNCNRAFAATGNSLGYYYNKTDTLEAWVNNYWGEFEKWELDVTFSEPTIWEVLCKHNYASSKDWKVFYSQRWPASWGDYCFTRDLFPALQESKYNANFSSIDAFYQAVTDNNLPTFSFLEPAWFLEYDGIGYNGTDYHPPANLCPGEKFLNQIYTALGSNQAVWNKTLLIINFDEHGGMYDHQPPPWDAVPPWNNKADGTPVPEKMESEFQFDRFGVRVPLILVSPYIEASTVFRSGVNTPFDHCSVIATILEYFGIDRRNWKMGSRVEQAPTFANVITRTQPRTAPALMPRNCSNLDDEYHNPNDAPVSDLQLMIAHRTMATARDRHNFCQKTFAELYDKHFKEEKKTLGELCEAYKALMTEMMGVSK